MGGPAFLVGSRRRGKQLSRNRSQVACKGYFFRFGERRAFRVVAFFSDRLAGFLPPAFLGERLAFRLVVFLVIAISLAPPERAPHRCDNLPLGRSVRGSRSKHTRPELPPR
jgi:hypothetical protein